MTKHLFPRLGPLRCFVEARGSIEVKGIARLETWLLKSERGAGAGRGEARK